jgi:phage-related protein
MVLLHAFVKKTGVVPAGEKAVARIPQQKMIYLFG